jgi:uncharacterized protein with HEPN domain
MSLRARSTTLSATSCSPQMFVAGFDIETFKRDIRTLYAVTRCLEIISEASRRLPADLKRRHPSIAWQQMASAGNVYHHD